MYARRALGEYAGFVIGWSDWISSAAAIAAVAIAVGELARDYGAEEWVADANEAAERLAALVQPGDVVLVKGSRSVGLERVAAKLNS